MSTELNSLTRLNDINECYRELFVVDNAILAERKSSTHNVDKLKELEAMKAKITGEIADYTAGKR